MPGKGPPPSFGPFEDREPTSSDTGPGESPDAMRVAAEPEPARPPSPGTGTRYPRPAPMDADAEGPPPGFGARAFSVAVDPAAVSVPGAPRARAFAAADAAAAARDERAAVGSAAERARACPLRRTEAFFSAENADDKNDKNESAVGDFQNEPLRDARAEVPRFPGAGSTFRARSASAASLVSSVGSVGSVASEDTYFEVGTLGLGSRRRWGERKGETTTTPGVSLPRRRLTRRARRDAPPRLARSPQDSVHRPSS
jgi:hypothetical protein